MKALKSHFSTIHDILLIHAAIVTFILWSVLQLWAGSTSDPRISGYLGKVACVYQSVYAVPATQEQVNKECLLR
jgi:hypothetical protein